MIVATPVDGIDVFFVGFDEEAEDDDEPTRVAPRRRGSGFRLAAASPDTRPMPGAMVRAVLAESEMRAAFRDAVTLPAMPARGDLAGGTSAAGGALRGGRPEAGAAPAAPLASPCRGSPSPSPPPRSRGAATRGRLARLVRAGALTAFTVAFAILAACVALGRV